jgi:N-acetylated-alpha-linked acidic dipeptidase
MGVPSTDIGSEGPYGVYHSVFDNYNWFIKFADPTFVYEQQQARVFGLEILHMADADVLPYDYRPYAKEIEGYIRTAQHKSEATKLNLDFSAATKAAARFSASAQTAYGRQTVATTDLAALNHALRNAESALLDPDGLPRRSWYKHTIYAPGEFTGYAAVVIPGVTEAIDEPDAARAQAQLARLTEAVNRAAASLELAK